MDKNEQEGRNDTHTDMNTAVNVMFTQIPASRGFNLFGERLVAETVKVLNKLDKGAILGRKVIVEFNPDVL